MIRRPSCIVLGGGGFLGTNLCRRLAASGARTRAFGRQCHFPAALEGVEWYQGDFSDPVTLASAIGGHDVVFHLIHGTTPQSANLDMAEDLKQTVVSTLALLEISRSVGVKRVVFVSSGGVLYGPTAPIPTPEVAPTDPITAYGISKLAIEKYFGLYEHLHGLDYRILRVANPIGPFQVPRKNQGVVAALISRALDNDTIEIWGDGSTVRDYVFVDDVIDALEAVRSIRAASASSTSAPGRVGPCARSSRRSSVSSARDCTSTGGPPVRSTSRPRSSLSSGRGRCWAGHRRRRSTRA